MSTIRYLIVSLFVLIFSYHSFCRNRETPCRDFQNKYYTQGELSTTRLVVCKSPGFLMLMVND